MTWLRFCLPRRLGAISVALLLPALARAADGGKPLEVHALAALPFALLLGAIAILPLVREHWWHSNRNKGIVSLALAVPVVAYLLAMDGASGGKSTENLLHELREYASFILLL